MLPIKIEKKKKKREVHWWSRSALGSVRYHHPVLIVSHMILIFVTSLAKEVMFLVALVSLSVCLWTTLLKKF